MTLSDSSSHAAPDAKTALPSLTRLYNFDLPRLKKTGQGFPANAEPSTIKRVLDIATGTGEWARLIAQAHPEVEVVGIDTWQLDNIPADSFDLVNVRFITGLLSTSAWPSLLQACFRVTRSGGSLCLTETDLPIIGNPASGHFSGLVSDALFATGRSFSPTGRLLSVTPSLKYLLLDAGYQNVQQEVYTTNFSAGMEAYAEVTQDLARTYQLALPFLVAAGVAAQEAVEQSYQAMLAEMQSADFVALAFYLSVSGKKP